jgi:hypothetical protein
MAISIEHSCSQQLNCRAIRSIRHRAGTPRLAIGPRRRLDTEAVRHMLLSCAELDTCIVHLHSLVETETDEKTARQLTFWLRHVESVPGVAAQDIGQRLIQEVSGLCRRKKFVRWPASSVQLETSFAYEVTQSPDWLSAAVIAGGQLASWRSATPRPPTVGRA